MTNDIYSRLLAGESLDDIMNQFAEEANAAQARIAEERKAAEEAAAKAAAEKQTAEDKRADMANLIYNAINFAAKYYPSIGWSAEEVANLEVDSVNAMAELALAVLDFEVAKSQKPKIKVKTHITRPKGGNVEDIFADFFKSIGL